MRFEVPQFIEIEDKIFGPLTWRQFVYLGGGVGLAVVLFFTNLWLFMFLGIPLGLLAVSLAFIPINSRPFHFFLEALFNYLTNQKLYLWRQRKDIVHKTSVPAPTPAPEAPSTADKDASKKDISSLARRLELQALQKNES